MAGPGVVLIRPGLHSLVRSNFPSLTTLSSSIFFHFMLFCCTCQCHFLVNTAFLSSPFFTFKNNQLSFSSHIFRDKKQSAFFSSHIFRDKKQSAFFFKSLFRDKKQSAFFFKRLFHFSFQVMKNHF